MSASSAADSATLRRWLDTVQGAEYAGGLSNHLPMALLALHRLGADEARLQAFAERYAARLQPAVAPVAWPAGEAWTPRLGELAAEPAYRGLFMQWLALEDPNDVLRQVLPRLMQGCGGAAFHGLIRTAHAVQLAHPRELADALAYWACRWLPLGTDIGGAGAQARVADPAAALRRVPVPRTAPAGKLIFQRMQALAAQPGFGPAVACLHVTEDTLQKLARGAAQLYAASGNFSVLHLLTSAHALQVLMPWLDEEPEAAVRAYWRAFAAAWAASGAHDRGRPRLQSWPQILAQALASDDEHVVKLVDSCRELEGAYGRGPWRLAASRAVCAAA
jgi:hypothetical protein